MRFLFMKRHHIHCPPTIKIDAGLNLDNVVNLITTNLFIYFSSFFFFSLVLVSESQPLPGFMAP